jgi:anti-sigma regulatory factor (Ser/Thr protein kinase)
VTGGALLRMRFTAADLPILRLRVADAGAAAGLDQARCDELVLAVYELACNAILHGGGGGGLLLSREGDSVRCRVADDGPGFVGTAARCGGGLWLAEQLTDAIEIDGGPEADGAVVTLMVRCRSNSRRLTD